MRQAGTQQKLKTGKTSAGAKIVNNYVLGEQIGKGTFGVVRLCEHIDTKEKYAIKIIDKSLFKNKIKSKHQISLEDMKIEAAIMKRLNHENVVCLIDVIDDPKADQLYLVQEYCSRGAIMDKLKHNSSLDENTARKYFRDLLSGIDYLHAHSIIHRDIKPMNLLLTEDSVVKIGDFGAARVLQGNQSFGIAGTPAFMAPELLGEDQSQYNGPAVDLWSCGATLFMLVTGDPPWIAEDEPTLAKRVQNDELVFPNNILSPHLRNLLTRLLVKDPAQRMTLTATMEHEWVTEEGAEPLARFIGLQPPLLRVNSTNAGLISTEETNGAITVLNTPITPKMVKRDFSNAFDNAASRNHLGSIASSTKSSRDFDLMSEDDADTSSSTMERTDSDLAQYDIWKKRETDPRKLLVGERQDKRQKLVPVSRRYSEENSASMTSRGPEQEEIDSRQLELALNPLRPSVPLVKARGGHFVPHCNVTYGFGEAIGNRPTMEDFISIVPKLKKPETFFTAIFDGHNGDKVAKQLKSKFFRTLCNQVEFTQPDSLGLPMAIRKTCLSLDREILFNAARELLQIENDSKAFGGEKALWRTKNGGRRMNLLETSRKAGSTALFALIRGGGDARKTQPSILTIGWVGDSRAVLSRAGQAIQVTFDHKAEREDEKKRIRDAGGVVDRSNRVHGDIAVSRAFGDLQHKGKELRQIVANGPISTKEEEENWGAEGTLIALPDVRQIELTSQDEFVILASDGIWDVMTNEQAVNVVRFHLHRHGDVRKAAMELVDKAIELKSVDNVSAVVVGFVGKYQT